MQIEFSDIMKPKDGIAIAKSQLVFDTASGLPLTEIEKFGVSQTVIDTIEQAISDYQAVEQSTGNVKSRKKGLTENLTALTKEANEIMRNQVLETGKVFIKSNNDFYRGLVNSSKVVHVNIHTKARVSVKDENDLGIADALIVITSADGSQLKGKTSAKGNCTISRVPEGSASMTVSKPNFIGKTYDGLNFERGKTLNRAVTLLPVFDIPAVKETKKKANA
jgi:hypothetical protein